MDRIRRRPLRSPLRVLSLLLLPLSVVLVLDSFVYAMPPIDRETGRQPPCHTLLGVSSNLGRMAEFFSPLGAIAAVVLAWRR
jgi:hypothetical protein